MDNKEDANGTVRQMEDFAAEQPTADRAGLLATAEGATNGSAHGDGPKPKSPDGISASSVESGSEVSPLQMDQEKNKAGTWHAEGLKVIIVSCIVFSLSVTVALIITIYYGPSQASVSPHGAVASTSEKCSEIGTDILKDDGSAVDAAIATVMCEGVVSSHVTGIGGGGFMIYRNHKDKKTIAIDFREVAPGKASKDMYGTNLSDKKQGAKSVAVPGLLKGLEAAHKKYGKKPWKELIMPAVNLARNGFNVTEYLVKHLKDHLVDKNGNIIGDDPEGRLAEMYLIDGNVPEPGDKLRFPKLANTLEQIAEKGAEEFYSLQTAKIIAAEVQDAGGFLRLDDLQGYTITQPDIIESKFKELTLQTLPPPAGGAAVLTMLNVMDLYSVTKDNKTDSLTYHRLIEAMKFAQAEHDALGDPADDAIKQIVLNATKNMISHERATEIRNKIDDTKVFNAGYYGSLGTAEDHGTSHVSVIGPDEEMVALTSSINFAFGSHFLTTNGVLLNNEMDDFSVPGEDHPDTNNFIAPGKRPMSSMAPTVVFSKTHACAKRMAIGGTNAHNITTGVAEVILNAVGFEESIKEAVAAKRVSPNRLNNIVLYEGGMNADVIDELTKLGHQMELDGDPLSMVYVAAKVNETVTAESDPRVGNSSKASIF